MPPHLAAGAADRRSDHRVGYERRYPSHEVRLARAEPRHQVPGFAKIGGAPRGPRALISDVGRLLEQRAETERVEVDGAVDDTERGEETADPRLRGQHEPLVGPAPPGGAERRD